MVIAIDNSPLVKGHFLQHRVRGTGFYIKNLQTALQTYFPNNSYVTFFQGKKLSENIDIVHIPYFEPFFLTLPLRKIYKTVVTIHDLTPFVFPQHFPPGVKGKIKWQIQKNNLKHADAIITDSLSSKKDIAKFTDIDENKIHVVYLAAGKEFGVIENRNKKKTVIEKYNLPEEFILYVGDVTWNKNLPSLIKASLEAKIPLVLVGNAIQQKDIDQKNPWNKDLVEVQKLVQENKSIKSLGFVPTEELVILYNLAIVFVIPSFYEGFGLPLLEAMICGCPAITSKVGSLSEIGNDAVIYADPYNTTDLVEKIKTVFKDEALRDKLRKKGLEQAKKFTWKKTAKETIDVYQKVIQL